VPRAAAPHHATPPRAHARTVLSTPRCDAAQPRRSARGRTPRSRTRARCTTSRSPLHAPGRAPRRAEPSRAVQRPGSGLTLSRAPLCSDPGPARARAHVHRLRRSLLSSPPHAPRPSSPAPLRELPGLPARTEPRRTEPTAPRRGRLPAPAQLLPTLARTP
jgi:hypothetical protein